MAPLEASWTKLASTDALKRSSHTLSTINNTAYIFGGELQPRQPRDNNIHTLYLSDTNQTSVATLDAPATAPSPRVGSSSTNLNGTLYLFSGRGGESMTCIEENGSLWTLKLSASTWELLKPADSSAPFPEARSYHAMTSDAATGTIYTHAGCPASGRLNDLWSFDVKSRKWSELTAAPGNARGGTSVTFVDGKLYRMNGFDGKTEQGGALEIYDPKSNEWSSVGFPADGKTGPGARSVASLLPVTVESRQGTYLVTMFGEADPSNLGHMGAGKMLGDVWAFSLVEQRWEVVEQPGDKPEPRGWFDADVYEGGIVVSGGLGGNNERLDDAWVLTVSG